MGRINRYKVKSIIKDFLTFLFFIQIFLACIPATVFIFVTESFSFVVDLVLVTFYIQRVFLLR